MEKKNPAASREGKRGENDHIDSANSKKKKTLCSKGKKQQIKNYQSTSLCKKNATVEHHQKKTNFALGGHGKEQTLCNTFLKKKTFHGWRQQERGEKSVIEGTREKVFWGGRRGGYAIRKHEEGKEIPQKLGKEKGGEKTQNRGEKEEKNGQKKGSETQDGDSDMAEEKEKYSRTIENIKGKREKIFQWEKKSKKKEKEGFTILWEKKRGDP